MKKSYFDKVHIWGGIWNYAALAMFFLVPIVISLALDAWPDLPALGKCLAVLIPLYWSTAVVEIATYIPMMGAGATYLSFVTGNIANLKLPCCLNAMENANVKANTEEGEVISTLATAVSAITTTVVIAVGVLAFSPVLPKLTADGSVFKAAFENVLPALFGALGASYFIKHWRLAIAPILCGVIILIFAPTMGVGILMFITIVIAILGALIIIKTDGNKK